MGSASMLLRFLFRQNLIVAGSPTATTQNVFLLCLTAILKVVLTAWTFGTMVCALLS
jgi:hypothetical protein